MAAPEYYDACYCAGNRCGGHGSYRELVLTPEMTFTPIGYQGPAQHTYTAACAGFHAPGPCPPSQQPVTVRLGP